MLNVLHVSKKASQIPANQILNKAIMTQLSNLNLAYQSRELCISENYCVFCLLRCFLMMVVKAVDHFASPFVPEQACAAFR
jgi:hypothetical protein